MDMHNKQRAFTLIELAIALIIIGLIAGGIIVGQSLIRSSELVSIISDAERYKKAAYNFYEKYNELPGDMSKAENLWGSMGGGCPPGSTHIAQIETCNGNSDGKIGDGDGPTDQDLASLEPFFAWQHLANSGFIEGLYSGAKSITTDGLELGVNIPKSKINLSGYTLFYTPPREAGASASAFASKYGNIIVFGAADGLDIKSSSHRAAITAREAYSIDKKIDDGKPGIGSVLTFKTTILPNCANSNTEATAIYSSNTGISCSLIFLTGF